MDYAQNTAQQKTLNYTCTAAMSIHDINSMRRGECLGPKQTQLITMYAQLVKLQTKVVQ